jgi:hypothetical protein
MRRSFRDIFIVIFPMTALLFGGMTYVLLRLHALGIDGMLMAIGLGFGCGMVFGIGVGYLARSVEVTMQFDPSVDFFARLQLFLQEMGYRPENQFQKVITFEPTTRAGIFADRVRVELLHGAIRVEGPRYHLEKLQQRFGV